MAPVLTATPATIKAMDYLLTAAYFFFAGNISPQASFNCSSLKPVAFSCFTKSSRVLPSQLLITKVAPSTVTLSFAGVSLPIVWCNVAPKFVPGRRL